VVFVAFDAAIFAVICLIALAVMVLSVVADEVLDLAVTDSDGPINVQFIAAFLSGFGAVAYLVMVYFDAPAIVAAAVAVPGGGVPLALGWSAVVRFFRRQEVTTSHDLSDVVGSPARALTRIDSLGFGSVEYTFNGQVHTALAITSNGERVENGAFLKVVGALGSTLLVAREPYQG